MSFKGKFKPQNKEKYAGDPNNIWFRSTWECKVMSWLDKHQDVISWG
jgi:hypothetical protein